MQALYLVAFLWGFWALFVCAMNLYRVQLAHGLTPAIRMLGAPLILVAYAVDVFANLTVATAFFVELPRELLVTSRLRRYIAAGTGWRFGVACWLCRQLLDPLDPTGNHCR